MANNGWYAIKLNQIKSKSFKHSNVGLMVQFNINPLFVHNWMIIGNVKDCSIWLIDRTLSGATIPSHSMVDLEVMDMKGYFTFLKVPVLLESYHQIVLCHIQDVCWESLCKRCSWCIPQPQPTGPVRQGPSDIDTSSDDIHFSVFGLIGFYGF